MKKELKVHCKLGFKGNKIKAADSEYISNQCDHPTPLLTLMQQE